MCGLRRCIATRRYVEPTSLLLDYFCFFFQKRNVYAVLTNLKVYQNANAPPRDSCREQIRANQRTKKAPSEKGASQTASLVSDYFISPYKSILKALTIDFELVFCSFLFRLDVIYLSIKYAFEQRCLNHSTFSCLQ